MIVSYDIVPKAITLVQASNYLYTFQFSRLQALSRAQHMPQALMVPKVDSVDDLQKIARACKEKLGQQRLDKMIREEVLYLI